MKLMGKRWVYQVVVQLLLLFGEVMALPKSWTFAQSNIVPDSTLGAESSVVTPNVNNFPVEQIDGGAVRGANLFHSFQEFNVSQGRAAYFISPGNIQNVLVRVTGGNRSEILGTLGTFGSSSPNLFLMNPNGILFGPNASLDVGGSFVATTANGIRLGDNGFFSASEPASSNLLSVNPSALFFNALADSQAKIINQSTATKSTLELFFNGFFLRGINGLEVLDGKSLLFVGGDVRFDGGKANAPGGRIELGGLRDAGSVAIDFKDSKLGLVFPSGVTRSDVFLNKQAVVGVAENGGIAINARNIDVREQAEVSNAQINIAFNSVISDSQDKDISLNATGIINLVDSKVLNTVDDESSPIKGGNINVKAGSLSLTNSTISTDTSRNVDAGNITVAADTIDVNQGSKISSSGAFGRSGKGGNITLGAEKILLSSGGKVSVDTIGAGNAGSITLNAKEVLLSGNSQLSSSTFGSGSTGDIFLNTGLLSLTDGTKISTSTFANVDASNITIAANTIDVNQGSEIISNGAFGGSGKGGNITLGAEKILLSSGGKVSVDTIGAGNAGSITLNAKEVLLSSNSQLSSTTFGSGSTGNIFLNTGLLSLGNGAKISTSTFDSGNAGNVVINVGNNILLDGVGSNTSTSINSRVLFDATGNGGNLTINTGSLDVRNGANIRTSTNGSGSAGNINIIARDTIDVKGASEVSSGVLSEKDGQGGNVTLSAEKVSLSSGSKVNVFTSGTGNAGNVTLNANSLLLNSNSQINSDTLGSGSTGNIFLNTGLLSLTDGAKISTDTYGSGNAGNIVIDVGNNTLLDGLGSSTLTSIGSDVSFNASGNGGSVSLKTGSLSLSNGAIVSTGTFGLGNAGNVLIDVENNTLLDGVGGDVIPTSISSDVFSGAVGNGGSLTLKTGSLLSRNGAKIRTRTLGRGNAGNLTVDVRNDALLDGVRSNGTSTEIYSKVFSSGVGSGGNIDLKAGSLSIINGASLGTATAGKGNAGNVTVNTGNNQISVIGSNKNGFSDRIFINRKLDANGDFDPLSRSWGVGTQPGVSSSIYSVVESTGQGNGGGIKIDAGNVLLKDGGVISNDTLGIGNAGNIEINARDTVNFQGVSQYGNFRTGVFSPRGIEVLAEKEFWDFDFALPTFMSSGVYSIVEVGARGNGGNVKISTNKFNLTQSSGFEKGFFPTGVGAIITTTLGDGKAGDILINARDSISTISSLGFSQGIQSSVQPFANGDGGNIDIFTGSLQDTVISTQTLNNGNAGNITINVRDNASFNNGGGVASIVEIQGRGRPGVIDFSTGSLFLGNGAQIVVSVSPFGRGDGNNITVRARDKIVLDGLLGGALRDGSPSGIYSSVQPGGVGRGANIKLEADSIFINNNARVSTKVGDTFLQGFGLPIIRAARGDAGSIEASARELRLDNQGKISAESVNGRGGDIKLSIRDLLLMRRNSQINAVSGVVGENGVDGNIGIDSLFLIALPSENSDIIATGRGRSVGSNVQVDAPGGIFGIDKRLEETPESDIVATGTTTLNTPGVDPTRRLNSLPVNLQERSVAVGCPASIGKDQSRFVVIGQGGLAPDPTEPLSSALFESNQVATQSSSVIARKLDAVQSDEIIEAQAFTKGDDGELYLVAEASPDILRNYWQASLNCNDLQTYSQH